MPFLTEHLWATLHEMEPDATRAEPLLVLAAWPPGGARDDAIEAEMGDLVELLRSLRNLRTEAGLPASAWLPLVVTPSDETARAILARAIPYLGPLARVRPIELRGSTEATERGPLMTAVRLGTAWLGERGAQSGDGTARREAAIREVRAAIERLRSLLGNPSFVERAPEAVVARERDRLAKLEAQLRRLEGG